MKSPISCSIPFDENGKHHGNLRLPYSRNDSAWGAIVIPITVVRNGDGPTALLTGGNHGDEYEGPIALQSLAMELDPGDITGRVIIVPYMNYPAFRAATRVSPIDGRNLNRIFPGRYDGTPTEKIAHYFNDELVPLADVVIDYHSGGKTLDFVPFACAHYLADEEQQARCVAAVRAFDAPWTLMLREIDPVGMYDTAVELQGKTFVTTELGGGGSSTARSARIARQGARNVLIHSGVLKGELAPPTSRMLDMPDDDCYHFAEIDGMIEFTVDLGDPIAKDERIARIWPLDRTGVAPQEYLAKRSGFMVGRHFPGLIQTGDCLAVIAVAD